jgi:hypothetical protein
MVGITEQNISWLMNVTWYWQGNKLKVGDLQNVWKLKYWQQSTVIVSEKPEKHYGPA